MAVTKYTKETFSEITGNTIINTSQLKLFNILLDEDRTTLFMNIFRTYRLNEDIQSDVVFFDTYEVNEEEFQDNIGYKVHGDPTLWWVVDLINSFTNPFEDISPGDNIKILKNDYIYGLIKDMERLSAL